MDNGDADLVRGLMARQGWAGDLLFSRYGPMLCRMINVWTRHWHDAEDLRSETWIKALGNLAHYDPARCTFRTWLVRQARDVYIAWVRKNGTSCLSLEDVEEDPVSFSQGEGLRSVRVWAFQEALSALSLEDQDLLNLSMSQGMSMREIVPWFALSEEDLRQRKCRAKKNLLKKMMRMEVFRDLFAKGPVESRLLEGTVFTTEERSVQEVDLAVGVPAG